MGRLVREGLDRHDPARPPRGRRAAPAKGAAQTSAPKTQAAAARGADSAAPSAAKVSAQAPAQPGDQAADRPDTSAAKPAGDATSAPKTRRLGRPAAACAQPAAPPRTRTSAAKTGSATDRAIPAAVKREVWRRDRGGCRYVDRTSGRRCGSQHLLQIDHVVPYACGGAAEPNNLRLLCAAHHRYRHAGAGFRPPRRGSAGDGSVQPRRRRRRPVNQRRENVILHWTWTWAWPPSGLLLYLHNLEMRPVRDAACARERVFVVR